MSEKNKHIGQSFDTFLKKNGDYEAVTIKALQRTKAKLEAELAILREKLTRAKARIDEAAEYAEDMIIPLERENDILADDFQRIIDILIPPKELTDE